MTILDVGCGDDPNPNADYFVDIDKKNIKNFIQADAHNLPFKDNSFDVIISRSTIEHCINPAQFISELTRVAKEKVEIWTDNGACIGLHVGEIFIRRPDHLYLWTGISLKNFLRFLDVNFTVLCTNDSFRRKRFSRSRIFLRWIIELRFLNWIPCKLFRRHLQVIIKKPDYVLSLSKSGSSVLYDPLFLDVNVRA